MSTALPVVRGASAALYPFTLTISFDTVVQQFENAAQQRWARREALVKVALNYSKFSLAQKETIKAAFVSAKGQFDTTLTLTFGGVTFGHLAFDQDEFAATESSTMQYDIKLNLSQTISGTFTPGTAGTTFPTLANGCMGQLPYTQRKRFQSLVSKMAAGPKYTYAQFAGGLTGFPTDGLMAWDFEEQMLSDADLATRLQHFIDNWGRLKSFDFVDEDATTFSGVHYSSDELAVTYNGPNSSSLKISLEQTN